MTFEIVLLAMSVLVAAISTIVLLLNRTTKQRESRQGIQVSAEFQLAPNAQGTSFIVHLVNMEQRPIYVVKIALILKSGEELLPLRSNNRVELEGREPYDCQFPLYDYRDKLKSPFDVKYAEVLDSRGLRYRFDFGKIKKEIRQQWTSETDWLKSKGE